jgi:diguanylate cyclase (GGDEF)-like protein/PAS domain S-box-containing protein
MTNDLSNFLQLRAGNLVTILENSINVLDQVVIITNNPNTAKDGLRILYVNNAFCRMSGYSKDEVIGLKPSLLQGPETSQEVIFDMRDTIKNERSGRWEMVNYTKDKKKYWIELSLAPLSIDGKSCDYFIGYSSETTHYKKSQELALEKQEDLEFVLESAGLGHWDLDLKTNMTTRSLINDNLFGYKELQKKWTYSMFLSHVIVADRNRVDFAFTQAVKNNGNYDIEFRCEWPDNSIHWLWSKGRIITDEHNQPVRAVGIQADIDEKKNAQEKIYNLAYIDELTQLPNRSAFNKYIKKLLFKNALKNTLKSTLKSKFNALFFIDLDDFKLINDTHGHNMGDALLIKVAQRLKENLPNINMISRFGGDEFVILIESLSTDIDIAQAKVEHIVAIIRGMFKQPFHCNEHEFYSKTSIGVTLFNDSAKDKFDLLQQADLALYDAKACGKNTHRFYNEQLQLNLIRRTNLENDLQNVIINNELYLVYQPKVSSDNKIVGVEALIRWQHPTRGIVSPAEFIPVAEDTGIIIPIGEWVLKQALTFMKKWPNLGFSIDYTLSINISPTQFSHELFVENFTSILKDLSPGKNQLILEITENTVIENLTESLVKINMIKEQGVTFSLDDFGSGFSSLNYLKLLPINEIKIDKSFIDDISVDQRNEIILSAIITTASKLDLNLVVEGVESIEQVNFLNDLGAKIYQGFYFSKPLSEEALISFVKSRS